MSTTTSSHETELPVEEAPELSPEARKAIHACVDYPIGQDLPSYAAVVSAKRWPNGSTLRVRFLDGDPGVQAKVKKYANVWSEFANIKFAFGNDPHAEIRITFLLDGSWSTIGTDALTVPDDQPTMNFGWLDPTTPDQEYSRVVTHEFGHALGLIHEHQNPAGGIKWNKPVVYRYYQGPPNRWSKSQVDLNLFKTYSKSQTQFSNTDPRSIMMYPIPAGFTTDGLVVGMNTALSATDKAFIAQIYPKV